jgi:hypothetical protein
MTSWRELWHTPGPQDAEQILPGFLKLGFDFADFAYAFPSRPFLITSAIRDYFPIAGARRAHEEMKRLAVLADQPARAGFFEFDDTHGWSQPRREAAARWLDRWFRGEETDGREAPAESEEESDLYAAPGGLVNSLPGAKTVADWNRQHAAELRKGWRRLTPERIRAVLAMPDGGAGATAVHSGSRGAGVTIVAVVPQLDAPEIAAFRKSGHTVMAVVPRGAVGSMKAGIGGYDFDYQLAARAWLLGLNLPGIQTADILAAVSSRKQAGDRVFLYAKGALAPAAMFASALEPAIERLAVENSVLSYTDVINAKIHARQALTVVPGILERFDLPQVLELAAAKEVTFVSPVSPNGVPLLGVTPPVARARIVRRGEDWALDRVLAGWF